MLVDRNNDYLYVFGGRCGQYQALSTLGCVWRYNVLSRRWARLDLHVTDSAAAAEDNNNGRDGPWSVHDEWRPHTTNWRTLFPPLSCYIIYKLTFTFFFNHGLVLLK
jgi:hypothetical protein